MEIVRKKKGLESVYLALCLWPLVKKRKWFGSLMLRCTLQVCKNKRNGPNQGMVVCHVIFKVGKTPGPESVVSEPHVTSHGTHFHKVMKCDRLDISVHGEFTARLESIT